MNSTLSSTIKGYQINSPESSIKEKNKILERIKRLKDDIKTDIRDMKMNSYWIIIDALLSILYFWLKSIKLTIILSYSSLSIKISEIVIYFYFEQFQLFNRKY